MVLWRNLYSCEGVMKGSNLLLTHEGFPCEKMILGMLDPEMIEDMAKTSLANRKSDTAVISSYQFTLDGVGNRIQIEENEPLSPTLVAGDTTYGYIERKNRLISAGADNFTYDGAPMEQNYIRRVFKKILQKAELREIRFHDMRHTYASLLLSDGVTPVYAKEQMGHSSIQMTVDIYGRLIPSSNRGAVNRLDTHLNLHPNAPQPHPPKTKEAQPNKIMPLSNAWCRRGDSNPYVGTHTRP
jgi:hypothetical protein